MSISYRSLILVMAICSSCATTAKRQEAALHTVGASRMYGDAIRFGVLHTGRPPDNVRFGESITEVSLNSQRDLKDADLQALSDLPSLQELRLDHTNITDRATVYLESCPRLRLLALRQVQITDASLPHIAKLTQLRELDLWGTRVTSDGLQALTGLHHLEELILHDTSVTDDVIPILSGFRSLHTVGLGNTKVTDSGKQELRRLRPGIIIYPDDSKLVKRTDDLPPLPGD